MNITNNLLRIIKRHLMIVFSRRKFFESIGWLFRNRFFYIGIYFLGNYKFDFRNKI